MKTKNVIGSAFFLSTLTLLKEIDDTSELKMLELAVQKRLGELKRVSKSKKKCRPSP